MSTSMFHTENTAVLIVCIHHHQKREKKIFMYVYAGCLHAYYFNIALLFKLASYLIGNWQVYIRIFVFRNRKLPFYKLAL